MELGLRTAQSSYCFCPDLGALDAHILRRWGSREEEIKKRWAHSHCPLPNNKTNCDTFGSAMLLWQKYDFLPSSKIVKHPQIFRSHQLKEQQKFPWQITASVTGFIDLIDRKVEVFPKITVLLPSLCRRHWNLYSGESDFFPLDQTFGFSVVKQNLLVVSSPADLWSKHK